MTLQCTFEYDINEKMYRGVALDPVLPGIGPSYRAEGDTLDEAMIMLELEIEKDYGVRDDT